MTLWSVLRESRCWLRQYRRFICFPVSKFLIESWICAVTRSTKISHAQMADSICQIRISLLLLRIQVYCLPRSNLLLNIKRSLSIYRAIFIFDRDIMLSCCHDISLLFLLVLVLINLAFLIVELLNVSVAAVHVFTDPILSIFCFQEYLWHDKIIFHITLDRMVRCLWTTVKQRLSIFHRWG